MSDDPQPRITDTPLSEKPQHPRDDPAGPLGALRVRRAADSSAFPLARVLASRLRARRVELGLTRERLALRAGVPPSTIKAFERTGRIGLEAFMRLASALGRLNDMYDILRRRRIPDSPRVMGRRIRARTRGRAASEEPLEPPLV